MINHWGLVVGIYLTISATLVVGLMN